LTAEGEEEHDTFQLRKGVAQTRIEPGKSMQREGSIFAVICGTYFNDGLIAIRKMLLCTARVCVRVRVCVWPTISLARMV
jgi:hypothetical protein